jgi:hypothetical protein
MRLKPSGFCNIGVNRSRQSYVFEPQSRRAGQVGPRPTPFRLSAAKPHYWGLDIFFIKVILDQGHSSRTTRTRTGRVDAIGSS